MDLVIDADHITYLVSESNTYKTGFDTLEEFEALNFADSEIDFNVYKKHFQSIVDDYILTAECACIAYGWGKIDDVKIVMSDKTNFRFDVFPDYKKNRVSKNKIRTQLKKWARKKFICEPNTEADDVVAYYVRNGALGITTDKDLYKGVEGIWYNAHYMHKSWMVTSKEDAEEFFKCQILAGDGVDAIPSLPRVGLPTAKKLMFKHGSSYQDIVQIFKDKGFDVAYMLTMTRLVCMSQWTPKHGIRLWEIPNEKSVQKAKKKAKKQIQNAHNKRLSDTS